MTLRFASWPRRAASLLWLSMALSATVTRVAFAQAAVSDRHDAPTYQLGSRLLPRVTLLEVQYPQGVDVGFGGWAILSPKERTSAGLVGELELGLSGVDAALGAGVVGNRGGDVEDHFSIGIEGVALRSWPGWSLALPADESFVGLRAFGFASILRCSAGVVWSLPRTGSVRAVPLVGCGVGFL
jgi:hypothetical protein